MHVTSNPRFDFHDDVFPAFTTSLAKQERFPRPAYTRQTIIPDSVFFLKDKRKQSDEWFSSLEGLNHISTVKMKLNGTENFVFKIAIPKTNRTNGEIIILECNFFDGTSLFSFGIYGDESFWMKSDYFDEPIILSLELTSLQINFNSSDAVDLDVIEAEF